VAFSADDAEHVDAGGVRNPNPSRGLNKPAMAVELEPPADYVMAVYLSEDKLAVLDWVELVRNRGECDGIGSVESTQGLEQCGS